MYPSKGMAPMSKVIDMTETGRIIVPSELRAQLGLKGHRAQLQIEIVGGALVLRPVIVLPLDDVVQITPALVDAVYRAEDEEGRGLTRAHLTRRRAELKEKARTRATS